MSVVHDTPGPSTVSGSSEIGASFGMSRPFATPTPLTDARRLELLEHAVTVALSSLDYADVTAWGDALTASICVLAGATAGAYLLPGPSVQWRAVTCGDSSRGNEGAGSIHDEATERLHQSGQTDLVLWARDDLALADTQHAIATCGGTVGVRVRSADGSVAAVCVHRDRALGPAPQHLIAALRAFAPAFRAGVGAWASSVACRSNVAGMLDSLVDPALMFDVGGALVHANPAAGRLTSGVDSARLRDEAQRVAWALGAIARRRSQPRQVSARAGADASGEAQSVRRVQIGAIVYRLRGSIVGEQLLGAEPAVLVTITAASAEPMTDDTLRTEFGLTAREIEVARLLAEGLSNNEIADRLGVRFFTARNHVERTLAKLGVASRHRVGPLLRNEAPEISDSKRASAA
jgi:DNA-binding CsgD family transcriptional regulator